MWPLRRKPDLTEAPISRGRLVSVIIPARNEAGTIGTVLSSVLASNYQPFEVLVVNDGSTDNTGELGAEFARRDPRVRVITGAPLPEGWFGKPWACWQGYREARGDLLLFTDADTRHQPALLGHAVGTLEQEGADLVTVVSAQRCVTFWERVIMPQIWILLALRYPPARVNRATRARDVIANGQFILVTRAGYEAVGTHEIVHDKVAEDLGLAQAFLRKGKKLHFAFAESLIETRMYTGWSHIAEGWSKNLYLGGQASYPDEPLMRALVPVGLAGAMLIWIFPMVWLLLAVLGILGGLKVALVVVGLSLILWATVNRGMKIPPWYALFYPLGATAALAIILRSTLRGHDGVRWKGRVYSVSGKQ
ncbi:MAG: glycosyltransferase family 2 protein [Gemmatimonadota bacterium]